MLTSGKLERKPRVLWMFLIWTWDQVALELSLKKGPPGKVGWQTTVSSKCHLQHTICTHLLEAFQMLACQRMP